MFSLFSGILLLVETNSRLLLDPAEIDLVSKKLTDVRHAVLHHGRALERQTEAVDTHVLGQTHGLQHFGSEHTRVTDLNPLLQALVVAEDLHTGLFGR